MDDIRDELKRIFFPTEEEIENFKTLAKECYESLPDKVNLIKDSDNDILLASDPFQGFKTDCSRCKYYEDSPYNFVEGGSCSKHHIDCGWGFTCEDWNIE